MSSVAITLYALTGFSFVCVMHCIASSTCSCLKGKCFGGPFACSCSMSCTACV